MKAKTLGISAAVVVGLALVGSVMSGSSNEIATTTTEIATTTTVAATTTIPETTTTQQSFSDADLQIMAMRVSVDLDELCPLLNDLVDAGLSKTDVVEFAINEFENGFGQRLETEAYIWLNDQLSGC
jgi:hypothetical protein